MSLLPGWGSADEDPLGDRRLRAILSSIRTIAVVGASRNPAKPAHRIPAYLAGEGFRVIPVAPGVDELFGERAYPTLADVDEQIDAVDVFRPPAESPEIAAAAVAKGVKVLWLQPGAESDEARRIAQEAGVTFVSGICMGTTHARLTQDG